VLVARASSPGGPAACTFCEFEATTCPQCEEGLLVERTGPHGQFMGCTAWRSDGSGCGFNSDLPTDNES
jgi:hypothetical protein